MMVPGIYSSSSGDLKRTSWPGGSTGRAQAPCDLLNWSHWACFLERRKFLIFSISTGCEGLPGHCMVLLCRISHGDGILGPMGVDQRSSRAVSRNFLDGKVVLSAVLMVPTCLSIKPLDLGKCGDEVWCSMQWHIRNSASSSDANGSPLSVDSNEGGRYCDMSSSKCVHRDWALLVDTLYVKGYLLKASQIIRYS